MGLSSPSWGQAGSMGGFVEDARSGERLMGSASSG
jgi:hypothetical protein